MGGRSTAAIQVTIELYGVPRLVVGRRVVALECVGRTLGDAAAALAEAYPELRRRVLDPASGWPNEGYLFAVGERFTRDPGHPVAPGEAILLVASAAGGAATGR